MKTEEFLTTALDRLEHEFTRFSKSAADSLTLDHLRDAIGKLTDAVRGLPKTDVLVVRKRMVAFPHELQREMEELREAMGRAGYRVF